METPIRRGKWKFCVFEGLDVLHHIGRVTKP